MLLTLNLFTAVLILLKSENNINRWAIIVIIITKSTFYLYLLTIIILSMINRKHVRIKY